MSTINTVAGVSVPAQSLINRRVIVRVDDVSVVGRVVDVVDGPSEIVVVVNVSVTPVDGGRAMLGVLDERGEVVGLVDAVRVVASDDVTKVVLRPGMAIVASEFASVVAPVGDGVGGDPVSFVPMRLSAM